MRRALAAVAFAFPFAAGAAGGHHGVDDASILGAGECELEGWVTNDSEPKLSG